MPITRAMLYDEFVTHWIKRAISRRNEMCLDTQDQKEFMSLSRLGFIEQSINYLKELSVAIYKYQDGNPSINNNSKAAWKKEFFDEGDLQQEFLRESTLITRVGKEYKFLHKSILEYGLSLSIYDPFSQESKDLREELINYYSSITSTTMHSTSNQPFELLENINLLLGTSLKSRNLVLEPSVIQFLVDRVGHDQVFKGQLLSVIQQSKSNENIQHAAANAITILVKAEISFNNANLNGIRIQGADLSYGLFDSAELHGSDLRKSNLQNIWLRSADLSGSFMDGVQFKE
jgi:hypothetical protein